MPIVALVCAGLLALADAPPPAGDLATAYREVQAAAGRTPDDQVRLALWCEAHGLTAERMRHLALAVLADPGHATARGLAGLVARDGRWVAPDAVARAVQTDAATRTLVDEYNTRRSQTPYTADAQWSLGVWADEQGLKPQARAHFVAVTRLDPGRDHAWKRLGFKQYDGRWTTHERIVAARAEADAQDRADRTWKPKLAKWREMLGQPDRREAARVALLDVTDPRALPSIVRVFGTDRPADQQVGVDLLGQINSPAASRALAALSLHGQTAEIRRIAAEVLARRDPRDFVDDLVALVRQPWRMEVRPTREPGGPAELFVAGERYNIRQRYQTARMAAGDRARAIRADAPTDLVGGRLADLIAGRTPGQGWATPTLGGPPPRDGLSTTNLALVNAMVAAVNRDAPADPEREAITGAIGRIRQNITEDIQTVQTANRAIQTVNDRVLPLLIKVTGRNLGENHDAWAQWDSDLQGYAYQSGDAKPTYSTSSRLYDCFAAGTPVRTIDGTRAIEQLARGDLVLAQDTASGVLSYQPVLTAFHHPATPTYHVQLGGEDLVATGIHRFWQAGKGWVMTRDLKVGDSVRVLGGVARVDQIALAQVRPVFNLEVAEGKTFFVGRLGALVHDNSLVEATPTPFDAPPTLTVAR